MEKYKFDKDKHLHQLLVDGQYKNLTGCTTVLSVLAKPALIPWAAKMTAESFKQQIVDIVVESEMTKGQAWDYLEENLEKIYEIAKSAHTKRKEAAGDFGTKTHDVISQIIGNAIKNSDGLILKTNGWGIESMAVQNFLEWAVKNKVKFLETEKNIYSETLFLGGIIDFICEIEGEVWYGDLKTSKSGLYAENYWQMGGYQCMCEDMGIYQNPKGYVLLNLKESGEFKEKRSISVQEHKQGFLACLDIYRLKEKTTKTAL